MLDAEFPTLAEEGEIEEEVEEVEEIIYIYLDKDVQVYWEIYSVALMYLGKFYRLDPNVLLPLLQEAELSVQCSLRIFAYMHIKYANLFMDYDNASIKNTRT